MFQLFRQVFNDQTYQHIQDSGSEDRKNPLLVTSVNVPNMWALGKLGMTNKPFDRCKEEHGPSEEKLAGLTQDDMTDLNDPGTPDPETIGDVN